MAKTRVFLSHISEEAALATIVKRHLEHDFLGLIDVFVSTDSESIMLGSRWLDDVDDALRGAAVEIILCSDDSVKRPWINFEAGAGWVTGIPIVPLCHTGMRPVDLPIPLNLLQAAVAAQEADWANLYRLVARRLGSRTPTGQFAELVREVGEFEQEYGIVRRVRGAILPLLSLEPGIAPVFAPSGEARSATVGGVPELQFDKMRPHLDLLQDEGILSYATSNFRIVGGPGFAGTRLDIQLLVHEPYEAIASRVMSGSTTVR